MAGEVTDPLQDFLEEARRRALEAGPIPEPVLNELKLLLLTQRRELFATGDLASYLITIDGLAWRERWLVPVVLESISAQCTSRSRYGSAVGRALNEAAEGLRSGEWNLAAAHEMVTSDVDEVHAFGVHLLSIPPDEFGLDRSGRKVCEALLAIASRIIDFAAIGLELVVIAWARVLSVTDPMTNLVGTGMSQVEAEASVRSANFPRPPADVALATEPLPPLLLRDWLTVSDSD